jgi:cytochrome P450
LAHVAADYERDPNKPGIPQEISSDPDKPQDHYRRMRAEALVHNDGTFAAVIGRAEVEHVFRHPEVFSSNMDAIDLGNVRPLIPLQIDPPDHLKYRKLLDPLFAPREVAKLETDVAALVNQLIDGFIDRGECEFCNEFAVPLPSSVFLRLLGLPYEDLDHFLWMKDGIIRPAGETPEEQAANRREAGDAIYNYFDVALDERERERRDDMLSAFLDAEADGVRLTREEILDIGFLFLIAGLDTVTDALECDYAFLARHPEHRRQIVEDPSVIPSAVEEMLRWESPVPGVARICVKDTELAGCPITSGQPVGVLVGAANTDGSEFPEPETVDFRRDPNRHLAFGGGVHRCLGSHLARLELRVALREWHRRIPEYSIKPGTQLEYTGGLRSLAELPLVFGS